MNAPLLTIEIHQSKLEQLEHPKLPKRCNVVVEQVCETKTDERAGCLFLFENGKRGFLSFEQFSFV